MAVPSRSEFIDLTRPLCERLNYYDPSRSPADQPKNDAADPAKAVPQGFIDAMTVREEVYVKEQNVPLENEFDDDDPRSFHWVAYASIPAKAAPSGEAARRSSTSTKIPIGTIRLVPPPHAPHHSDAAGADQNGKEAYVKLGRLAVIKEFRKTGISRLLVETALTYARDNPYEVGPQLDPASVEALKKGVVGVSFKGLVLVHSQTGVAKVWKRFGFEQDETMGNWDEEGIEHIGMWKRLDVTGTRRRSKIWLSSAGISQ